MLNQRTYEEKTQQGVDKVTRYHWTVKNAPGEFLMIPKAELEVDHVYQRNKISSFWPKTGVFGSSAWC